MSSSLGFLGISGMNIYSLSPCWIATNEFVPVLYDVHPIIKWLSKYLPIDPWIDGQKPLMVDANTDKIYQVGNSFYLGVNAMEKFKNMEKVKNIANQLGMGMLR